MIEFLNEMSHAVKAGEAFALATVVKTWNSAPRPVGSVMVVNNAGEVSGSLSGGCVEGAAYEVAQEVLATGVAVYNSYGVSDDDAFSVGLTCGGTIEVFTERIDPKETWFAELIQGYSDKVGVATATVVTGPERVGSHLAITKSGYVGTTGLARLDEAIFDDSLGLLEAGNAGIINYGAHGERLESDLTIFVNVLSTQARMIIFGAIDYAAALTRIGKLLGYHVTVCDARPIFATKKRFPQADEIVVDWPHRYLASQEIDSRTVIVVLTHDPKFDVPVIKIALDSSAGYIGAMGSRKTHLDRLVRLKEEGVDDTTLTRLHSPIGLDLGARTPDETAVSIAAEIIQTRWGGTGIQLRVSDGSIHGLSTEIDSR
ncbi:MAG TPA: XdhC family protein [Candidatus Nanopelagicaceae bacterium]|nr:XdhC family protein [Candidatus Nanopelagicaceae bacterium]